LRRVATPDFGAAVQASLRDANCFIAVPAVKTAG